MILKQAHTDNNTLLINLVFGFFPICFVFGNLIININILLFCCLGIFYLKSKILTTKFDFSIKIIFLFFLSVLLSTILSFIKSLYLQEYEDYELAKLIKSIAFLRFYLLLIIIYLLNKYEILNYKYFFFFATCTTLIVSLDIIYQYINGVNTIGFKGLTLHNSGFFGDELIAGGFIKNFSFFSIFSITFLLKDKKITNFFFTVLTVCILGTGILLSGNRMPLILFIFGLFLIFLFKSNLKKIIATSILGLFIVLGFILFLNNDLKTTYLKFYLNVKYDLASIFERKKDDKLSEVFTKLKEEGSDVTQPNIIDEKKNEWEKFINPPKWEGGSLKDDFEFFWVMQYEKNSHTKIYLTALDVWGKNKIFGNGIKSFRRDCHKIADHKTNRLCSNHPHNYYLEILTEVGLVGLVSILIIAVLFLFFIFKNYKILNNKSLQNLILFAATISLILEGFPIKTTGSVFTTSNATYLILIVSIITTYKKVFTSKDSKELLF